MTLSSQYFLPGIFLSVSLFFGMTQPVAAQKCVLRKDEDSIRVYACANNKERFKSIQASFTLKAKASELASVLMDVENYTEWQFNTTKARILKSNNDHELVYYIEVDAPWPISNRDLIVKFLIQQDTITKIIKITANGVPDYAAKVDGLVRVPSSASQWTITPAGDQLKITYSIQIDPGGAVPAWMANMVADEAPWQSFRNLKNRIKKLQPAIHRLKFIED